MLSDSNVQTLGVLLSHLSDFHGEPPFCNEKRIQKVCTIALFQVEPQTQLHFNQIYPARLPKAISPTAPTTRNLPQILKTQISTIVLQSTTTSVTPRSGAFFFSVHVGAHARMGACIQDQAVSSPSPAGTLRTSNLCPNKILYGCQYIHHSRFKRLTN